MGQIQNNINQVLGTASAAAFAVNKSLDTSAQRFDKEAEKALADLSNKNDHLVTKQGKIENARLKEQQNLEGYQKEIDNINKAVEESGITSVDKDQVPELLGFDMKQANEVMNISKQKMSDLQAANIAAEQQRMKIGMQRKLLEERQRHNSTIIGRLRNNIVLPKLELNNKISYNTKQFAKGLKGGTN